MKKKIVLGIGGASGATYTADLLAKLHQVGSEAVEVGIVRTKNAAINWDLELARPFETSFAVYENNDFYAPFASGSSRWDTMIVCPCSMGLLSRIASGASNDLITRAADVMLKERRKLILVTRETPLSLIHIENMQRVTLAGGIVCPAVPSFYHHPKSVDALVGTVVDRVLDLAGVPIQTQRWSEENAAD